jgi:hypothetical protein
MDYRAGLSGRCRVPSEVGILIVKYYLDEARKVKIDRTPQIP